jgi:nucleotidyltransferase/DNA polymerase involved in DNA repair
MLHVSCSGTPLVLGCCCCCCCSLQVYRILLRHTPVVQPLSCDEAFFDITGLPGDPQERVAQIRREIKEATHCTASAGKSSRAGIHCSKPMHEFDDAVTSMLLLC